MTNSANVEALYQAIEAVGELTNAAVRERPSMTHQEVSRFVAGQLAARGVLVPSSLSDEDCREVALAGKNADGVWDYQLAPDVREELELIARGETDGG